MSDTDSTSPWYEFVSYCRCSESLGIVPSVQRFFAYQRYLKSVGIIK